MSFASSSATVDVLQTLSLFALDEFSNLALFDGVASFQAYDSLNVNYFDVSSQTTDVFIAGGVGTAKFNVSYPTLLTAEFAPSQPHSLSTGSSTDVSIVSGLYSRNLSHFF